MANIKTSDVLKMVPRAIDHALYRAHDPSGAPTEGDMKVLTRREEKRLKGGLAEAARAVRAGATGPVTHEMVAKEAVRRVRIAIRAVAGPTGTLDAKYLSQAEIARIADAEVRSLVGNVVSLRANIDNWYTKSPKHDGVQGVCADEAHEMLRGKPLAKVVVAVIDSGVDIAHEDLQGKIWTNSGEIPNNGIDDDHNGFVDDVHGWSFLGSVDADGNPVNVHNVSLEVTREVARYERLAAERELTGAEKAAYAEVKQECEAGKAWAEQVFERTGRDIRHYYDLSLDERAKVIGDDPDDLSDRAYGNNDVTGPDSLHGTHVAGIIAANRNNGLGFNGVAESVEIMSVRAVPNGDEADKDVANAIRYAVDNGADILNMSFGKRYSPHAEHVTAALAYASSKGVLICHAAGNEAEDNDATSHFPTAKQRDGAGIGTWIEVGAMSAEANAEMPAAFSNYGAKSVDLFAPGVRIDATLPGNQYGALNGTSMATPVVAGVLAMMKAAAPEADGERLKAVLLETVRKYPGMKVWVPYRKSGKRVPTEFSKLSKTGGVVDAKKAIRKLQKKAS